MSLNRPAHVAGFFFSFRAFFRSGAERLPRRTFRNMPTGYPQAFRSVTMRRAAAALSKP